ncbi:MAG: ribonuclease J [Rhodobacteraceae bacterium]|nr:ribonuclease J [Paracoccaceae bacterium]
MAKKNRLIYMALGGAGEIGMNTYLYGYGPEGRERFILVDIGVTFPDMDSAPGVDLIMADIAWLAERRDRIDAIFITHAHEDHVGALGLLHGALQAPVYARPFTAAIARLKLEERGQDSSVVTEVGPFPVVTEVGPFKVSYLPISHSIPESAGLVIDTPTGRVVHTGDFKLDQSPLVGEAFDPALWQEVARPGVKALVCDSTNVFSPNAGRSEATLIEPITALIASAEGMVVATTFASNVARLKTLAEAGRAAGRSILVLGRAMQKMIAVSQQTGVLADFPATVTPDEAGDLPRGDLMVLVTGSQGERRAGSAQLANGKYNGLVLQSGDMFLFSSKTIPGNEVSVTRIANRFSELGVDVVDDQMGHFHVSGHANRPDLERMHTLVQPQILIPMHGEHRHLREHARLGEARGIASVVAPNGAMVDLSGNRPKIVEQIETGRTYLDGNVMISAMDGIVRDRIRMALNGHVAVGIVIDEDDEPLGGAWVETHGLPDPAGADHTLADLMEEGIEYQLSRATNKMLMSDEALEEVIRRAVRKIGQEIVGKKPEVRVMISRLVGA